MDLPGIDLSLLVTLPKLIGPDLQRLRESIDTTIPTGAGTRSPPSRNRSTPPSNVPASPTRSFDYAINAASTAAKPPTRS